MDAYSSYIIRLSEARVDELRREAAEYALSRAARSRRDSLWARARNRFVPRRPPAVTPEAPAALPRVVEAELRRSA